MSGVSYQFLDWLVEPELNQLRKGKNIKSLEPLAMNVLALLLERSGEVVTTDSLLDQLWEGRSAEPGMVARCIAQIRQALDDNAKNPIYIETIRKRGYRAIAPVEPLQTHAEKTPAATTPSTDETERTTSGWPSLIGVLIAVFLGSVTIWWITHQPLNTRSAQADSDKQPSVVIANLESNKTIAVLPFADMSPDGSQEYFGDGMAEELTNELSSLKGLQVAGRTSSFSYKGRGEALKTIGTELNVQSLLQGSIRKDGNRIRVTAQLINAGDGYHLWSETYDRELADIFAIQEEIATSVSGALGIRLGVGSVNAFQGAGTSNIRAYETFLKGLGLQFDYEKNAEAINFFERATELDPNYSAAWSQLGLATLRTTWTSKPEDAPALIERAYTFVLRAVELNPKSAQSTSLLAMVLGAKNEWITSDAVHTKALSLLSDRPNLASYGSSLMRIGRSEAALKQWEQAEAIEPMGGRLVSTRGFVALAQGRFTDAQDSFALLPRGRQPNLRLDIALNEGDADHIKSTIAALSPMATSTKVLYAPVLSVFDSPDSVLSTLRTTYADKDSHWPSKLHDIAIMAAYFGDAEFALQAIGEEMHQNGARLHALWYPVMSEVRLLPGFKTLVAELNLVEYWRAIGWADLCRPVGEDDFECD